VYRDGMAIKASIKAPDKSVSRIRRLDRDGRLTPPAKGVAWRVIAVDRSRVDPAADYLFCAPNFLFPVVDINARALRLELEHGDPTAHA
jgi:hypothetical protein